MNRGDVYFVTLDPTAGREQAGSRPAVVVSTNELYQQTGVSLVCPITQGGGLARNLGYCVPLMGAGTRTQGVILCHQVKSLDIKARGGKYVETVPDYIIDDVLARVATLIE